MSSFPSRVWVVCAGCLFLFLAGLPTARALVLDWDTAAWTNGSTNNSYDLNGDGISDITIAMTKRGNGSVFTTDPASGSMTPAINQSLTGGLSPAQNSLMIAGDLYTNTDLTIHLSFTGTQPGATNVAFTIFDIDVTTNSDIISNIYGVAPDGSHVAAIITNIGSTVILTGTGLGQTLEGNGASANNTGNGNATISFGSTLIYDVFFTFSNTAGAPRYQDIALGDITFTPVPEINPAAVSAVSCIVALGLAGLRQRRARVRAKPPVSVAR